MRSLAARGMEIEQLPDVETVWSELLSALADAGLPHVIYITSDAARQHVNVRTTDPKIYAHVDPSQDPFLEYLCASYDITCTGVAFMDDYPYLPEQSRDFIRGAADAGFVAGLAVPMRLVGSDRFGGFNIGTELDRKTFESKILPIREELRFFLLLVHRRFEELGGFSGDGTDFRPLLIAPRTEALAKLSPREAEVIYLVAKGISQKECARMCGISPYTVAEYVKSAYRKLGVHNRIEAAHLVLGQA